MVVETILAALYLGGKLISDGWKTAGRDTRTVKEVQKEIEARREVRKIELEYEIKEYHSERDMWNYYYWTTRERIKKEHDKIYKTCFDTYPKEILQKVIRLDRLKDDFEIQYQRTAFSPDRWAIDGALRERLEQYEAEYEALMGEPPVWIKERDRLRPPPKEDFDYVDEGDNYERKTYRKVNTVDE